MRTGTASLALALLATPLGAGVEVTAAGDRLSVTAVSAPVSEVLEGLARKTRMKVMYEGGTPRTLVTIELHGRTPAEAVLGVLEGLGLNYALVLDLSGTRVETLMIVGGGVASASASTPPFTRKERAITEKADLADDDEEPAAAEIAPGEPHEVPREAPRPTPAPIGPLNPTSGTPSTSPFAPGPPRALPPPVAASPSPAANH